MPQNPSEVVGTPTPLRREPILGVDVSAINMKQALDQLGQWRDSRTAAEYVCVTPAHSLMDCRDDPDLRSIFNRAGMVTPDGMAVVWLLRLRGHKHVSRVYGPDLLEAACSHGVGDGWRHFFLGATDEVLKTMRNRLESESPGMIVAGAYAPPFRELTPAEEQEMVDRINAAEPDFVWIGLGSPRQERWMADKRGELDASALIGVGAAFDFLSGNKSQAPKILQRSGLEWLYRLCTEPRRLFPRYRRYPHFVVLAAKDQLARRRATR